MMAIDAPKIEHMQDNASKVRKFDRQMTWTKPLGTVARERS